MPEKICFISEDAYKDIEDIKKNTESNNKMLTEITEKLKMQKKDERKFEEAKNREALLKGDFSCVYIDMWVYNYMWADLDALAKGCLVNKDTSTLYALFLVISNFLDNPGTDKKSDEEIKRLFKESALMPANMDALSHEELADAMDEFIVKRGCERVLRTITSVAKKLEGMNYTRKIMENMCESKNENCRAYGCSVSRNYKKYLNDSNERIRTIANERSSFDLKWNEAYTEREKKFIEFIASIIESGMFNVMDGLVGGKPNGIFLGQYSSYLLKRPSKWTDMNEDILRMDDKRVFASKVYEAFVNNEIEFKEGYEPICYIDSINDPEAYVKKTK